MEVGGGGHGGGGGGQMGGGGGHMGGGGGHMGGGPGVGHFDGGHFNDGHDRFHRFRGFRNGFGAFGFVPYDDYAYDNCYLTQRYHTRTGWHTRLVYVCS